MRCLCRVDTTVLAALLQTLPGGLACHGRNSDCTKVLAILVGVPQNRDPVCLKLIQPS